MTEYEKMLSGKVYNAIDEEVLKDLNACIQKELTLDDLFR